MIQAGPQTLALEKPSRVKRLWFAFYLAFIAVFTIALGVRMTISDSPYIIGEWLINYSGGFVRRGLIGAVVLSLHHIIGVPLAWVVFTMQVATFLLFIVCVYHLTKGIRWSLWMWAVLLSPATLAFTVMDSYAGFRKEFLLFAALALVICIVDSGKLRDWQLSALLSLIAVGLVLSHEALVVGFPYFFAAVAIQKGSAAKAVKITCLPALLGGIALVAVTLHPGNLAITQAICSAVGGTLGPFMVPTDNICSGSIQWLQVSLSQARVMLAPTIRDYHLARLFSILAIPTFTPMIVLLVLFYRRDRLCREVITVVWCGLLALAGTSFLFYSALDWGRWVHIQAICLMLMVLMVDRRAEPVAPLRLALSRRVLRYAAIFAVAIYATTWTLPSIGHNDARRGYLDVIHMLRSYSKFK